MTMTMNQFHKKLKKWSQEIPEAVEIALKSGAELVRGEAVKNHLSGPKMARGVGSLKRGTLQPRNSDLRTSIRFRVKVTGSSYRASVGSNMKYARIHEKGGMTGRGHKVRMPKRPYLRPSVQKKRKNVVDLILKKIMEAYAKSGR